MEDYINGFDFSDITKTAIKEIVEKGEREFYEKYGRDKCEYGNKCIHCCPVCCAIWSMSDRNSIYQEFIGFRFKPKKVIK